MAVNSKNFQLTPKVKMVKCAFIPVISVSSKNGMYAIMGLGAHTPPMLIVVFDLLGSHNKSSKQLLSDFYYLVSFSLNHPILIFITTVSCFLNALLYSYPCTHKAWVSAFKLHYDMADIPYGYFRRGTIFLKLESLSSRIVFVCLSMTTSISIYVVYGHKRE